MKILHIGKPGNIERFTKEGSLLRTQRIVDMVRDLPVEEYLKQASDADAIIVDAITPIPAELIDAMPHLKIIHSEGVAFNAIDLEAATKRNIPVCNCAGMNAVAVAEQAVLLMCGMLRDIVGGDRAVRDGRQIEKKEAYMAAGNLMELSDLSIGLVGYGAIAKETARLLRAYGVQTIYYYKRTRLTAEEEEKEGVVYRDLPALLAESDLVSLHLPVNEETMHIADDDFFGQMKQGSYLVNTARGELVDDAALIRALQSGQLAMAGLDTLDDEPVAKDHPLLTAPQEVTDRILFSPHIGGITASSFRRGYTIITKNIERIAHGETPASIVNRS